MTQAVYIATAVIVGLASALQVGMIGSLGRQRGAFEATLISMLASILALAVFLILRSLRNENPDLPSPLDQAWVYVAFGAVGAAGLAVAMRGLPLYLSLTGVGGFVYVIAAAFLGPRIGIALYTSAVTAGTLIGAVALDHVGAFGNEIQRVDVLRLVGVAALLVGVVLVRGR
jgi:transporter family-2 protein